ncbi:MAG: WecB/TagA/CpsF family glycosyltransferase [Ardenticatenaceae bacterium]|nr:WecB/TagA/CpsF family glycosyltransferase [Ardenticatenaceae bacterium]
MSAHQHPHGEYRKSTRCRPESITVLRVPIHNLTFDEALARIAAMIATGRPNQIVTINPEFLVIARNNPAFHTVLASADLALADGVGLQLAAALQGRRFVSRVPGSELVYRLAPLAAAHGWRLFFLGAGPGIAERAAQVLRAQYPTLKIAVDGADPTPAGTAAAVAHIQATRPDILLVAYGAPTQDLWIARHGAAAGVPVMMGIGGTLDFVAGIVPRPPKLYRDLGIEWLYRLWKQPWRWHRQLRLPLFMFLVLAERVRGLVRI